MSLSVERTIRVPLSKESCLCAVADAVKSLPKCEIVNTNNSAGIIDANRSMGVTSYGERITFSVRKNQDESCDIEISVSPKGAYLLWRGQCDKVVQEITSALNSAIAEQEKLVPASPQKRESGTTKERLDVLESLFADGNISDEEYRQKRAEIIASL